jgi:hypothetical protein
MRRPTTEQLDNAGIKEEAHRFFVLLWNEIFDEYTFDSWQVRSSNLISILEEILISCEIIQRIHGHHPNILMLINEAAKAAENDLIVKCHFPFVGRYIDDLRELYQKHVKNKEELNGKILARATTVILGNLRDYRKFLFDDVLSIIQSPNPKYKIELYSLTISLAWISTEQKRVTRKIPHNKPGGQVERSPTFLC